MSAMPWFTAPGNTDGAARAGAASAVTSPATATPTANVLGPLRFIPTSSFMPFLLSEKDSLVLRSSRFSAAEPRDFRVQPHAPFTGPESARSISGLDSALLAGPLPCHVPQRRSSSGYTECAARSSLE